MSILRRLAALAPLALLASLLVAGPAQAAAVDYGRVEDSVNYSEAGVTYTLHVAVKNTEDTTPNPDQWRGVWRVWCTRTPGSTPSSCNVDMFGMYLINCDFTAPGPGCGWPTQGISSSHKTVLGGPASKECNAALNCLYTGGWHNEGHTYDFEQSTIDSFQVRFLDSPSNHLSAQYEMCAVATTWGVHTQVGQSCNLLHQVP